MSHYSWDTNASFNASSIAAPANQTSTVPCAAAAPGTVLTVGAGCEFSSLSAAVAAASNGDTILVKAGTYVNDFADVTAAITIKGVGGMANFVATEAPTNLKGILTVDNNCVVQNCSFSGASISEADGGNAAGIRYEGGVMELQHDSFFDNQNGVMGTPVLSGLTDNTVTIDHCTFRDNGAGDGYTHNCYIGTVTALTFTDNLSTGCDAGHELKSRAYANTITGNVFADGPAGQASYEIDLPDGGVDVVEDNTLEKGPLAQNEAMLHFGGEGIPYAGSSLLVEGNRFVSNYGPDAEALLNQTPYSATITGNVFYGISPKNIASGPAVETDNTRGNGKPMPNGTLTGVLPGSTVIFTDDAPHTITLAGTLMAVEGGGGLLTATAVAGHVIAMGGSGGMDFTETGSSGGNTVTTNIGSVNALDLIGQDVVSSCGTDTIRCGACNVTGQVTGLATIYDGTGNNTWDVSGTAAIIGQGGNPVVSIAAGGDASISGTLGYLYVENNGGNFALSVGEGGTTYGMSGIGGAITACVSGGTLTIDTAGGPTGALLQLGPGTDLVTSAGNDTIMAGSGTDTIILEGAATVYAGTGSLSIYGRGDQEGANVYGNGGAYVFAGDTGNITYHGGALASTVTMDLYDVTLLGGAGLLTVNGGSRNVMQGGSGGLDYNATDGGGADQITTAAGASDTLTLAGADVVNSYGNDTIYEGAGNQTLNIDGTTTIFGGTGNSQLVMGGNDTLYGVGQDYVSVLKGATAHIDAGRNTAVNEAGAIVDFAIGPEAAATVFGGGADIEGGTGDGGGITISTLGGTTTHIGLGAGANTVFSLGADTIKCGAGSTAVTIENAADRIAAGTGALTITNRDTSLGDTQTVWGSPGTVHYQQDGGTLDFIAGSGSAVIDGGSGALFITGGAGSLAISGGSGGFHFVAGSGTASVALTSLGGTVQFGPGTTTVQEAGWGAADVFDYVAGHGGGVDTIAGFRGGTDSLNFFGVQVNSETIASGSTTLGLSDHTTVVLSGFADTGHLF